jgi:hypothetical protein
MYGAALPSFICCLVRKYGFLIQDGNIVNAYTHADAEEPTIFLIVDDVFQAWYTVHLGVDPALGYCAPLLKAIQGRP